MVWPTLGSRKAKEQNRTLASRLAQSATGRQPTTGILLPVQPQVNFRRRRSPGVYFSAVQRLSGCSTASWDGSICGFRQTGSGCLSTGSSFLRPDMASSDPDTATPMTPIVKEFSVSTSSPLLLSI